MALFSILISPLNAFPWVINGLMEAWVSTKRIQAFLKLSELDVDQYYASMADTLGECFIQTVVCPGISSLKLCS
jgi:ABC-type multidrug transport system fused ATPase/permease subunit